MDNQDTGTKEGYVFISHEACTQTTSNNQDQERLILTGYSNNLVKSCIFYVLTVFLCGIPLLLTHWYKQLKTVRYSKKSLREAEYVLVKDSYDVYSVHSIQTVILSSSSSEPFRRSLSPVLNLSHVTRFFVHNDVKYVWCDESHEFTQLRGWDSGTKTVKELVDDSIGYTAEEQELLLQLYGNNEIEVPRKTYFQLLIEEVLHPFYIFQLFSVLLWTFDDYVYYAACVVVLTLTSICTALYTTKKQTESLRELVRKSAVGHVTIVRRDGKLENIDSKKLVPGDIIEIPVHGGIMACDALLLHGNCIVNESTLTGESAPVTKTPPPITSEGFDSVIFKRHTLFCGTEIVQTRYYGDDKVKAIVINTGFSTAKGELVRSILHPKPIGFKFYEDSLKFVCCLFLLAAIGMTYLIYIYVIRGIDLETMILDSLDLITIVVPPALPAAMTTGIMYSQARLLKKGIFCISPARINVCGKLKLLCFDKTGTLTEEGLDLWGVVPCIKNHLEKVIKYPSKMNPRDPFIMAMATCHSLTRIKSELSGDPLDLSIFEAIDWEFEEPGNDTNRYDMLCPTIVKPKKVYDPEKATRELESEVEVDDFSIRNLPVGGDFKEEKHGPNMPSDILLQILHTNAINNLAANNQPADLEAEELPYEIGIVREFPFTSACQCMSVITRVLGEDHMNLYCKGAPEKIQDLCIPVSIPKNFNSELQLYTSAGYRVLGVAYKSFDQKFTWRKSQRVRRDEIEKDLTFLGLIIMQNTLKPTTMNVMKELRAANLRCVMITGDNLLTAISVSRDCLMVLPDDILIQIKVTPPEGQHSLPTISLEPVGPVEHRGVHEMPSFASFDFSNNFSCKYHYTFDGKTWALLRTYFSELIPKIIVRATVFARMLPEQKTQLIEAFQDLDYIVGMCGDGANDCGAMKAAHIGVSLSEAESSVAAPFTSKTADISCIVSLIKEGRCALVTSFVIFKYMAMYGLIQFISVLILYTRAIDLGTIEFLYLDLVITTSLALVIGRNGPASLSLARARPVARLVAPANVLPLLLQIILTFLVQLSSVYYLTLQEWFHPVNPSTEEVITSWENSVVYCVSSFQYVILAFVYSQGKPHRQPFYVDFWFMVTVIALTIFTTILCVYPVEPLASFFEIVSVEHDNYQQRLFRFQILIFPVLNLTCSFLIEAAIVDRKWFKRLMHFLTKKSLPKNRYKQIILEPLLQP